jgi:hypothetical protein
MNLCESRGSGDQPPFATERQLTRAFEIDQARNR